MGHQLINTEFSSHVVRLKITEMLLPPKAKELLRA